MKYRLLLAYVLCGFMIVFTAQAATATTDTPAYQTPAHALLYEQYPWAALFYIGRMADNTLYQVLEFNTGGFTDETLYSAELTRQIPSQNPFTQFFQHYAFASATELNINTTYRDDINGPIYEVNPYFSVRWARFPWNQTLRTSFAIGEGISYDSRVPTTEADNTRSGKTQRLLNFLMFETTFALPDYPRWELVLRVHHRSGAFGLYNARNSGSTAVGLGIRYRF